MYYHPHSYAHPYYANVQTPMYYPQERSSGEHPLLEVLVKAIEKEASAIELYRQLSYAAPNEEHKNEILRVLERKQAHLHHFTNLYVNLTGTQPEYEIKLVPFLNYEEGLQRAYEIGLNDYEEYRQQMSLIPHPHVQQVFHWVLTREEENANQVRFLHEEASLRQIDRGGNPFVVDIEEATKRNHTFRTALWTGRHLQVTLMSIGVGEDIGLEIHPHTDQFLRIEEGEGLVQMGDRRERLYFQRRVHDDDAVMIPAGKWHNVRNTGSKPLKLYSIYAPPEHPFGTVHETKAEAMAAEQHRNS